ncbi:MAG: plastocyanin/azurin family copper-binding protein [Alphaproteobacteria bacterium]|nr:plastocyanin/azurin family copper-binding protein [Alphaproteobacteria bacterium]
MIFRRNLMRGLGASLLGINAYNIIKPATAAKSYIIKEEDICDTDSLVINHEPVNDVTEQQIAAVDGVVHMLNVGPQGSRFRYDPMLSEIDIGGKILWKATTKGHNVEFMVAPNNIKFKSKMHKSAGFTFSTPGIYTYKCTPHVSAGMIGVVVVGNDLSNMTEALDNVAYYGQAKELIRAILERYYIK